MGDAEETHEMGTGEEQDGGASTEGSCAAALSTLFSCAAACRFCVGSFGCAAARLVRCAAARVFLVSLCECRLAAANA